MCRVRQAVDSLEYTQDLLNIIGHNTAVNPVMNAVCDVFNRRRFSGSFRLGNQGAELDTLLNAATKVFNDDDENLLPSARRKGSAGIKKNQVCYLYQSNNCRFSKCRYQHKCTNCQSASHGLTDCTQQSRLPKKDLKAKPDEGNSDRTDRPPHPRSLDRAHKRSD